MKIKSPETMLRRAAALLEFDAASYDMSARVGALRQHRKGYVRTMRAKERERRTLVAQIRAMLAAREKP